MKKLVLVRHGTTEWNRSHRLNSTTDIPLAPEGRDQMAKTAKLLADHPIDRIVHSPMLRAQQSAEIISTRVRCPMSSDARLTELDFGPFEGIEPDHVPIDIEDQFRLWRDEVDPKFPDGAESLDSGSKRTLSFLQSLGDRQNVLVVTHGVIARILIFAHVFKSDPKYYRRLRLDNAAYSEISIDSDGHRRLISLNRGFE